MVDNIWEIRNPIYLYIDPCSQVANNGPEIDITQSVYV